MLKHVKLGFGHTSEFTSYDVRAGRLTRSQAIRLVRELDGKCSFKLIKDYCDWIEITPEQFWQVADSFRGSMWKKNGQGQWVLDNPIWEQSPCEEKLTLKELIAIIDPRLKIKGRN